MSARDIGAWAVTRARWRTFARMAIHEAGHACLAVHLGWAETLRSMALTANGGWTQFDGDDDLDNESVLMLFDRIAIELGGRAAEVALIGSTAASAGSDIAAATRIAISLAKRGLLPDAPLVDLEVLHAGLGLTPANAAMGAVVRALDAARGEAADAVFANAEAVRRLALLLLVAPDRKLEGDALRSALIRSGLAAKDGHSIGEDPLEVLRAVGGDLKSAWQEFERLMVAGAPLGVGD